MLNLGNLAALTLVIAGQNVMGIALPSIEERAAAITMGDAATFGVVAATTITNNGASVITGECGVCPGSAITGFLPGVCTKGNSLGSATPGCAAAKACGTAFNASSVLVATKALSSANLEGQNLAPGVYTFPALSVTNTGILTLNGATNPAGQFIFQIRSTLVTSAASQVVLANGAVASNVFFVVGSSATLGAGSILNGNVLAHTAVTLGGAAVVHGTVCAVNAAITLDDNAITA